MNRISIKDKNKIENLYNSGMSIADIAKLYKVTYAPMHRYFIKNAITRRNLSDAKAISSKTMVGLKKWQQMNGSWYRGLNKDDPRVKSVIEKGRITQVNNAKNKGERNPMYGRVTHSKSGFRKDLGHSVRSSWEANFARILKHLKIKYEYEKQSFELKDGRTYTPDFFVPDKNKFYEIKGWNRNDKYNRFRTLFPDIRIKLIDEAKYKRLIGVFSEAILLDDKSTIYTKREVMELFSEYCKTNKNSVSRFCRDTGISRNFIKTTFGSFNGLKKG